MKGEDHQGNYLIHSWEEPEPEVAAKEGYNEEEDPEEVANHVDLLEMKS